MHVVPDPGADGRRVVTGDAAALDAWLWHRRDDAGITVTGDAAVSTMPGRCWANRST